MSKVRNTVPVLTLNKRQSALLDQTIARYTKGATFSTRQIFATVRKFRAEIPKADAFVIGIKEQLRHGKAELYLPYGYIEFVPLKTALQWRVEVSERYEA